MISISAALHSVAPPKSEMMALAMSLNRLAIAVRPSTFASMSLPLLTRTASPLLGALW